MPGQLAPMSQFVARCLEEIGLEGRCGLPVRDLFTLVDSSDDSAYRRYAWNVLRSMRAQVQFHYMTPVDHTTSNKKKKKTKTPTVSVSNGSVEEVSTPTRRKRKWSTTLLTSEEEDGGACEKVTKNKTSRQKLQPVIPSLRRIASKNQRRRRREQTIIVDEQKVANDGNISSEQAMTTPDGSQRRRRRNANSREVADNGDTQERSISSDTDDRMVSGIAIEEEDDGGGERESDDDNEASQLALDETLVKIENGTDALDYTQWILQSPRGYKLSEPVDASSWSYEDAIAHHIEGRVLGVVACEELRLKYLGVLEPNSIDTISPQFDLLELIGRSREQGANAAKLTSSKLFGDARKLHYLLDMLVGSNLVEKNIVTANQRRFNMVHLSRFAHKFSSEMISPKATMERESFPKELLPQVITDMLNARGERSCVFADIGRELGYNKRHQENLRKYFLHQAHINRDFPFDLFMARCNTSPEYIGRKLWCIRLRRPIARTNGKESYNNFQTVDAEPASMLGPVVERGVMEQMYTSIQSRQRQGATIPELRDMLGVPTFKLPYKLAQGLIANYNISVEQVVEGKSTMYRMFVPGGSDMVNSCEKLTNVSEPEADDENNDKKGRAGEDTSAYLQPTTMREATRGMLISTTLERRRNFILKEVEKKKIVSIHTLRSGLIEVERAPGLAGTDCGAVDIRSVRRILDDLEKARLIVSMEITIPPKRALQKSNRIVKCAAQPGYERNRETIKMFVDAYVEEQHRKYLADVGGYHNNDGFVVLTHRRPKRVKADQDQEKEIVKYSATSYKVARENLAMLHKQSRELGTFFGILYRCRAFHLLLWDRIEMLKEKNGSSRTNHRIYDFKGTKQRHNDDGNDSIQTSEEVVFALKDILDLLTIKEYIELVGVSELLTENEESTVRVAISERYSWEALSEQISRKIRGCEADRFSRMLRVLLELGLLQVVNDASRDLLKVFRSSDDFDSMVSKVAFATLSGGLFKIKSHARIVVKRGSKTLKQLPKNSYIYAPGFSHKSRSEHFTGRIPLEFHFEQMEHAKHYWKALRFLSVEGARLGTEEGENSVSFNSDSELILAAPLRDHNIYALKMWVPQATMDPSNVSARAKAEAAAAGPMEWLKRKRFHCAFLTHLTPPQKRSRIEKDRSDGLVSSLMSPMTNSESGVSTFRKLMGTKMSLRASKWSVDDDLALMNLYIEKMSYQWFIEVPLAIQDNHERVAFRTPSLSRTSISWKSLGKALNKNPQDCLLRVKELMDAPQVRARVQSTKKTLIKIKNAGGTFHEELAIFQQPRLAALMCRALQIVFHERSNYYSVLADLLVSRWQEDEVKLVWRYLWLAGLITRTNTRKDCQDQRQRGFRAHSKVYEMKSLKIAHYTMETFCEAAEYLAFLQENVKETAMLEDENDTVYEHELEPNAATGQAAVELSSVLMGISELVPEYYEPDERSSNSVEAKRAMAVKGLTGHLSRQCRGAVPDDFLREYWMVKSRFRVLNDSNLEQVVNNISLTEAFSTCASLQDDTYSSSLLSSSPILKQKEHPKMQTANALSLWLLTTLTDAGGNGMSLSELYAKFARSELQSSWGSEDEWKWILQRELDVLINEETVLEVNAYTHVRFVLKDHAELWTLNPYRISDSKNSNDQKLRFHFDKEQMIVARPWLHLDGSTNTKIALLLKRKVVNIVMCCPGIQDRAIHRKMRKIVSLQDMRSLLEELMVDEIIYARLARGGGAKSTSVFDAPSWQRHTKQQISSLLTVAPGDLRFINFDQDQLHYFPSINCVELFGSICCDADLGRAN